MVDARWSVRLFSEVSDLRTVEISNQPFRVPVNESLRFLP